MIVALMMGRAGSRGLKNKNILKINGKKLCEYPLIAATKSRYIKSIYVTTDCPKIKKISQKYKATIIERPKNCVIRGFGKMFMNMDILRLKKI